MKEVTIYGQSDDNIYVETEDKHFYEQFDAFNKPCVIRFESKSTGGKIIAHIQYCPNEWADGTWMIGLHQEQEDDEVPEWNFRFTKEGYSVKLHFDAPDDIELKCLQGEE